MKKLIRLHASDNVAVALVTLPEGEILAEDNWQVVVQHPVPALHKVALSPIEPGQSIYKYGQVIGFASQAITPGDHVHMHNCVVEEFERDFAFCRDVKPTDFVPPGEQRIFKGYRRSNGKAGTRNYIGIVTTVNCSATVAHHIANYFSEASGRLDAFPNVDGIVALAHGSGCGMRNSGEGFEVLLRTLDGYLHHPNFGAILLVGLGCETMQMHNVLTAAGHNIPEHFAFFNVQDIGGTRQAVAEGIAQINTFLPLVNQCERQPIPVNELILAVQCGGSDALSGITANPALGVAGDILIRHGGTVVYSETPEIFGAEHLMTRRASSPAVAEQLLARVAWWQEYTRINGVELNNNPSPGNKVGGLTTILEKSLGAQAKSGSTTLMGVYEYAVPITTKGLVFMDSPGFDPVSVTGQVASGANIICFTTGRGSAFGCKPVPSIKLATNTAIFNHMQDDMDMNCGRIIEGLDTVDSSGAAIFEHIIRIASGENTKSELLGYGDVEFSPWKIGAVV